jgi:Pentapeptide repeats (9 copies)
MNSAVVAAIIAAGASGLTLLVSVAAQIYGIHRASRDTKQARDEQSEQLDRTLGEQRTRTLNERFATAADRLGSDKPPAVRLAGVYAMAGLADDWKENRQTCIDVLCAYLRMPFEADPGQDAPAADRLAFGANQEVRHTVIRVITRHLRDDAEVSWQGHDLDFTGVVFDGGDFEGARFNDGTVSFRRARFSGGRTSFRDGVFDGAHVSFREAVFMDSRVTFGNARFVGGTVNFGHATFTGGKINFAGAMFTGGKVNFAEAAFTGSEVDFGHSADWSHPPVFDWENGPPAGVTMPAAPAGSKPG